MVQTLNIAMVVRAFATDGGLELYAHRLVEGLLEHEHAVTVFCQNRRSDFAHERLQFVKIETRSDKLPKLARLRHDHAAGNAALSSRAASFDIVHSQHYPTSHASVATFHNHTVQRWSQVGYGWEKVINDTKSLLVPAYRLRDEHDRELCANGKVLIFPSNVMKEDFYCHFPILNEHGTPFAIAHPGASMPATMAGVAPERKPGHPFTFLFVGRGFRRKGLDLVLSACARLSGSGRKFRLLVAGLRKKPLDRARLHWLGLADKVEYLGFRQDMDAVYLMADAALLPSRVEPFGMAPLQAMSFGLVPVVSQVSGVSEVLNDGQDCLILKNQLDSHELAAIMSRLMDEPALLERMRKLAPATAARVDWRQTVEATLKAYATILSSGNPLPTAVK